MEVDPSTPVKREPRSESQTGLVVLRSNGQHTMVAQLCFQFSWLVRLVLTVMNALPTVAEGLARRPRPVVEHLRGLGLVGDWVGGEGMLVDASLASAEAVAREWLGAGEARAA